MPVDVSADPWGAAMLGATAIAGLGILVILLALAMRTSKRAGAWILSIGLLGFLGSAVAGTFVRVRAADAAAAQASPPSEPVTIVASTPPADSDGEKDDAPEASGPGDHETEGAERAAADAADAADAPSGADAPSDADTPAAHDAPSSADAPSGAGAPSGADAPADDGDAPPNAAPDKKPDTTAPLSSTRPEVAALPDDPTERKQAADARIKDAKALTLEEDRCKDPQALATAWAEVESIPKDMFKDRVTAVVERLDTCRRRIVAARAWTLKRDRVNARKAFVDTLQKRLVADGISNAWVGTTGSDHDTLRAAGKGLDIAKADALLDAGLRDELTELGFVLAVFSDGKSGRRAELDPPSVSDLIKAELAPLGLGKPLKR